MKLLPSILLSAFLVTSVGIGQELQCDVKVNAENIPSAQRDFLRNFESDLERYLNNTRFSNEDLDGEKILCSMDIFFKTVVGDNRYQAQVFIGSQRPIYVGNDPSEKVTPILRLIDDRWEFTYVPNQRMIQDDFSFDPLTDFLDFYAYVIIGFDLETYVENSGSRYFQKALQIWSQANGSNAKDWPQSSAGYSRFGIIDEINNTKFQPMVVAFHTYHFDGIDLLATDPTKALNNMLNAIETMSRVRQQQNQPSVLVRHFFDAKYMEIAATFLKYPDRAVYDRLIAADPEHRSTYDENRFRNQ